MKIISYKKVKNNQYEVKLSNNKSIILFEDIILKYELLIDKDLSDIKLKNVLEENELIEAYYKALSYISRKMRAEKEIRVYLTRYEISENAIEYAVDKLKKEGYLDQNKYAEAYVNDSVNLSVKGPKKIKYELITLGIKEDIINKYLDKVTSDIWVSRIKKLIVKKSSSNKYGESLFKKKMYEYLIGLGYDNNDIKTCLDGYHINTSSVFLNEAEKVWNKLECKYSGYELEQRFKQKLYQKGYSSNDINEFIRNESE